MLKKDEEEGTKRVMNSAKEMRLGLTRTNESKVTFAFKFIKKLRNNLSSLEHLHW